MVKSVKVLGAVLLVLVFIVPVFVIEEDPNPFKSIKIFNDKTMKLQAEEILNLHHHRWSTRPKPNLSVETRVDTHYWFLLSLENPLKEERILDLMNRNFPEIDYFSLHEKEIVDSYKTSLNRKNFDKNQLNQFSFRFNGNKKAITHLLVRTKIIAIHPISFQISSLPAYLSQQQLRWMINTFLIGSMVSFILYNCIFFLSTRDLNYLLYVVYQSTLTFNLIFMSGTFYEYLVPVESKYVWSRFMFIEQFTYVSAAMFIQRFLKIKEIQYWMYASIHFVFIPIQFIFAIICLFGFSPDILYWNHMYLAFLSIIFMAMFLLLHHNNDVYMMFISFSGLQISTGVTIFVYFGFIDLNVYTSSLILIGALWEAVLMSLALSSRFKKIQRQHDETVMKLKGEEALSIMGRMLAHDIRKPHSILRIAIQQLSGVRCIDDYRHYMKRLEPSLVNSMNHVEALSEEVLNMWNTSLNIKDCSFSELIDSVVRDVLRYNPKNQEVHLSLRHTQCLKVDEPKIRRSLQNLVQNASESSPEDGIIAITSSNNDLNMSIRILNTGTYLPEEELKKLFELFHSKGKKSGSGLGLTICKKYINAHEGTIKAFSQEDPPEVWFDIVLPISENPDTKKSTFVSERTRAPTLRPDESPLTDVWVIDDDIFIQESWIQEAEKEGLSIRTFSSPKEAQAHLKKNPNCIDKLRLVILDFIYAGYSLLDTTIVKDLRRNPAFSGILILSTQMELEQSIIRQCNVDQVVGKELFSLKFCLEDPKSKAEIAS